MVGAVFDALARDAGCSWELGGRHGVGNIWPVPRERHHLCGFRAPVRAPRPLRRKCRHQAVAAIDDENVALSVPYVSTHVKTSDVSERDLMPDLPAIRKAALQKIDQQVTEEGATRSSGLLERPRHLHVAFGHCARPYGQHSQLTRHASAMADTRSSVRNLVIQATRPDRGFPHDFARSVGGLFESRAGRIVGAETSCGQPGRIPAEVEAVACFSQCLALQHFDICC